MGINAYLVISANGPEPLINMGLAPHQLQAVALEKCPEVRWLATLEHAFAPGVDGLPAGVHLYVPMTAQLTSSGDQAAQALR